MKYLVPTLLLALLAAFTAPVASAQVTDNDTYPPGFLRKKPAATPSPSPGAPTVAKKSGPPKPLEAALAKDNKGTSKTTSFGTKDPSIFVVLSGGDTAKGDKVKVAWIAEDVAGMSSKNKKLTESTQTSLGAGTAFGSYHIDAGKDGFPAGKYRADLSVNGKVIKSLPFTVK